MIGITNTMFLNLPISNTASALTVRSYSNTPFEASFIDLNNRQHEIIALDDTLKPLFQFAIQYLKKSGKTKINYLSAHGYALMPPMHVRIVSLRLRL